VDDASSHLASVDKSSQGCLEPVLPQVHLGEFDLATEQPVGTARTVLAHGSRTDFS
jgi:hypothetical protein